MLFCSWMFLFREYKTDHRAVRTWPHVPSAIHHSYCILPSGDVQPCISLRVNGNWTEGFQNYFHVMGFHLETDNINTAKCNQWSNILSGIFVVFVILTP
jgi:hypothetical protein